MKIVYGILNFKLIWDINAEENHKRQDVIYKEISDKKTATYKHIA
jgi:hypothetical protein